MKVGSWVYLVVAVWLAVSPFVLHYDGVLATSNIASGVVAALVALWSLAVVPEKHLGAWIALMIAFWVFSAPYGLGVVEGMVPLANSGLCGAVMMIFAVVRTLSEPMPSRGVI